MFLEKIEMQGFKSFCDPITIVFDKEMTGIVGPNGCGKSNIADAIRWVLGEQSTKSMRASSMSDVIFNGSKTKSAVNMASVSLTLNNINRIIDLDVDHVEITRRYHRISGENEYFINKKPCRLKDIINITLDAGIGRDSLSIISQGTISHFVDSKPIERRLLFEEAAGIAKYKKRKMESLSKLNRTQVNIIRLNVILDDIKKQVEPLEKAALKTEQYNQYNDELKIIEIDVLVKEISDYEYQLSQYNDDINKLKQHIIYFDTEIENYNNDLNLLNNNYKKIDFEISGLQLQLMELLKNISNLESLKIQYEEKSKYIIATGNDYEKRQSLKQMIADLNNEIEDRNNRINIANLNINELNESLLEVDNKLAVLEKKQHSLFINRQQVNEKLLIQDRIVKQPYLNNHAINTIISNKQLLNGVYDTVATLLTPNDGYELALSIALGGSSSHIVCQSQQDAKNAIEFLKKNKSGRATFTILELAKAHILNSDYLVICQNSQGYLGLMSDFVKVDEKFKVLVNGLLGNVVVVDNIDNALILANRLNYKVKIVTLDGDIFYTGGNMAGGSFKDNNSLIVAKKLIKKLEIELKELNLNIDNYKEEINKLKIQKQTFEIYLLQLMLMIAQLEPILVVKKEKRDKLVGEYESLADDLEEKEMYQNQLITDLNNAYLEKDTILSKLDVLRNSQQKLNTEISILSAKLKDLMSESKKYNNELNQLLVVSTRVETNCQNSLLRLSSQYQMTYEYAKTVANDIDLDSARSKVLTLRNNIEKLGLINHNAIEEYQQVKQRHDFLLDQLTDLNKSQTDLLNYIQELDDFMSKQFITKFEQINQEFDKVVKQLFNGGSGHLWLENKDDILESGIEVSVSPPGKSIQNLRLFSGGEKSLIAISVLFAIIKAVSLPLCIFDEVEAALDQANVNRFAKYINQFKQETQFIVVTHRPGTMRQCDALYGVTMVLKGVSSLLKVTLDEAVGNRKDN